MKCSLRSFAATLLATATLFLALPSQNLLAQCDTAGTTFAGGTGAVDDPFQISTIVHLNNIRNNSGGCNYLEKHFVLTKDLDFEDTDGSGADYVYSTASGDENAKGWLPIGHDTMPGDGRDVFTHFQGTPFSGSFDGGENVILNLLISRSDEEFVGLFGVAGTGGVVKNLGLENLNVSGGSQTGGLVGTSSVGTTISSCYTAGDVSGAVNAGGLAGESFGLITLCYSSARVTSSAGSSGGLVGIANSIVSSSYSVGDVTGSSTVGGFVGFAKTASIRSCYSTGSATGTGFKVGGFIGSNSTSTLTSCYSTGNAAGAGLVGGFLGEAIVGSATSCYSTGTATATSGNKEGGFVGNDVDLIRANTYWENTGMAIGDATDNTDRTPTQMKALTLANLGDDTMELSWDVGTANQYPALRTYKVNDSDVQVQGDVIAGQPCPRAECGPLVSIAAGTSPVTEGTAAEFTLTRTGSTVGELTVAVTVTGGDGFLSAAAPAEVTFSDGEAMEVLSIATAGDEVDEADGTVTVTITADASKHRLGGAEASVAVEDDDLPVVSISGGSAVTEGVMAVFTVTRVGDTTEVLTVMVEVDDGTDDFISGTPDTSVEIMATGDTATLSVDTDDDDGDEEDGVITATITASASTYRLGTATATVDVMDNDVVPPAPADLTASTTDATSVSLTWTAVAANPPVTRYQVKVSDGAGTAVITDWTEITGSTVTTVSHTVTGLTALTAYTFAIRAKNAAGDGEAATVAATTAAELPGAPTALMAGTPTSTTVPLTWTVATTGGDATAFQFKVSNADGTEIITDWTDIINSDATTASYTVTGLTAETEYTFAIRAKNTAGESAGVTATATTATAPTAPPATPSGLLAPAAETTSTSVGLTWTVAATDADISAYQVQVSDADGTVITAWTNITGSSVTTTSYTVTGLTAETEYTFAIRAKNTAGESDEVTVTATTKAASATLSFGGETIDDKTYTKDTAITDLVLPEATGGTGPYTYTLTPVPEGLEFVAATRTLSGMPTMVATTATTHTYTVTDSTTLTKTLTFTITVNATGTFGIGSTGAAVHVYPNPAGVVLHIEFSGAGEYGIALLTVTGQQVFGGQHAGGGTKKLDVSTLKGGVYFLKIEDSEGGSHTVRILR